MSASARDIARLTQRATNRTLGAANMPTFELASCSRHLAFVAQLLSSLAALVLRRSGKPRAKNPTERHDPDAPRRGCLIVAASVRAVPTRAVEQTAAFILLRWEAKARAHALSSQQRPSCSKQQHQERAQKAWRHHIRRQGRENGAKTGRPWAI